MNGPLAWDFRSAQSSCQNRWSYPKPSEAAAWKCSIEIMSLWFRGVETEPLQAASNRRPIIHATGPVPGPALAEGPIGTLTATHIAHKLEHFVAVGKILFQPLTEQITYFER